MREAPTFFDWLLVGIGVVFCLMGVALLGKNWRVGVVTLAFFGTCTAVFVSTVARKRREASFRASRVEVVGGADIEATRMRTVGLSVGLAALGAVLFFVGVDYPVLFRLLAAVVGLFGLGLTVGWLAGWMPRQFLRFDPVELTVGMSGYRLVIPWDSIGGARLGEFASNPILMVRVTGGYRVEPAERRLKAERAIAQFQGMYGAEVVIMPGLFGMDGPALAAAVARYCTDRAARAELGRRLIGPT